jgi:hypothetical protein
MRSANPLRLLLASAGSPSADTDRTLQTLGAALAAGGIAPIVLHGWTGAGRLHVDRSDARGYPVYRSDAPAIDIGLLAVLERPSAAVLFGGDALALAGPLVAAGVPVVVMVEGDRPVELGALEASALVSLAATTLPEAARLTLFQGAPVTVLPLPHLEKPTYEGGGAAILVLGDQRADGVAVALALAEARPAYRFVFSANIAHIPGMHLRLSRLGNVQMHTVGMPLPPLGLALLPHCAGVPPWQSLAALMAAGVPVLVGDSPLLAAGTGAAGLSLSLTAPAEAWFAALDGLMTPGDLRQRAEAACPAQAVFLRPSAAQVASLWRDALHTHIVRSHGFPMRRI